MYVIAFLGSMAFVGAWPLEAHAGKGIGAVCTPQGQQPATPGEAGHAICAAGDSFRAFNVEHGFNLAFRGNGFTVHSHECIDGWQFELGLLGLGRERMNLFPSRSWCAELSGEVLSIDHGPFRMRYENNAKGMRHDLIVLQAPSGSGLLHVRWRIGGDLIPVQMNGSGIVFDQACPGRKDAKPVLDYGGLLAWDGAGHVLPSSMYVDQGELVMVVDDHDASYPITIDPLSTSPDVVLSGTQPSAAYGYSVATAGDVNGDGYSDLLVGIPNYDTPAVNAGMVQLFAGNASGISTSPSWTAMGSVAGDQFGYSVSSAGDINGDGYSDVVVGAPGANGSAGVVYVYLGSATGLAAAPITWTGDAQAGCAFGFSVALAGDVNRDGYSDVVIGAPLYDTGGSDRGKAYLYQGAAAVPVSPSWTAAGSSNLGQYGFCVAGAGDLNGDGYSDVAIGAPFQNRISPPIPPVKAGNVFLFYGGAAGLPMTPSDALSGSGSNAEFGSSVRGAGDTNGDGYADLLVGSPGYSSNSGWVGLFHGSATGIATGSSAATTRNGTSSGDRLGASVATAGDLNGDGYADVVVGSPGLSTGKGRVMAFFGNSSGMNIGIGVPPWSKNGTANGDALGTSVGTAGDVNGDGISDLFTGAPGQAGMGQVNVYHGSPPLPGTSPQWSVLSGQANGQLGRVVASAGDVNGDGYADVLVGAPGMDGSKGRAMLYMGSSSGLSASAAWTTYGENALDQYGFSVASAGDVNGDGYSDVLVGAPSWPNYAWTGKAFLYLGGAGGLSTSPAWTWTGEHVGDRLGWSVSSAGDVNGDGYSDAAVGAYMYGTYAANEHGKAYVFHGSATGLGATPAWTAEGTPQSFYAASVSLAGDVNGDGYDDLIVGAPFHDLDLGGGNISHNIGAAFVYPGSSAGLSPVASWTMLGEVAGDEFGISASMAGDVNGDGYSDVVIGAYRHDVPGSTQAGRAYVFLGRPLVGLETTPATVIDGLLEDENLGISVCSAGDVNGDGFSDVAIGSPNASYFYLKQGRLSVHMGSASGVSATPSLSIYGPAFADAQMGNSVALAGDVNGDGYSDLVAGASNFTSAFAQEGGAYLYLGAARGVPMRTFQYKSNLSSQVRTSNGTFETACDWGIGQYARTSLGRGFVKLAWEYIGHGPGMPSGVLMPNNSTAYTGQSPSWTDSGLGGTLIKEALAGPAGSSHPAWRVRVRHHPATALDGRMYGRWFVQGIHDLQVPSIKTNLMVCGPLPITLVSSAVSCEEGEAEVEWSTATEQDCSHFTVLRSLNGKDWEVVATVPCSGSSNQMLHYRATDQQVPSDGVVYYRLDQYDINGALSSFPVMVLVPCKSGKALQAWPNPARDELFISLAALPSESGPLQVQVLDMAGRVVMDRQVFLSEATSLHLDGLSLLPLGPYQLKLYAAGGTVLGHFRMMRM
jgi:hypothetical protein